MIKRIRIQNYKALRDVTLDLTPIHALIGPNDSGKTSILEAIGALCRSVDHRLAEAFSGAWEGKQLVWFGERNPTVKLTAWISHCNKQFSYSIATSFALEGRTVSIDEEIATIFERTVPLTRKSHQASTVQQVASRSDQQANEDLQECADIVSDSLRGVQSYRWDGRFLGLPVAPNMKRLFRMDPTGFGLALLLDDILGFDRDLFIKLEQRFKGLFPAIKSIKLIPEPAYRSAVDDPELIPMLQKSDGKGLYFEFRDGGDPIPARQVSDGVLLVLAYLAVLHLPEPPRVLLIEEPENGIHPKRLQDVLAILRELVGEQSQTQVILTTHSPYAVDLFDPKEVTLCQKQDDGSVSVRRLSESQAVLDQRGVFTLGEIWTSEGDESLAQPAAADGESHG